MNNMDEKTISKYLAGECSETEMGQILQWLKSSEANRKEWLKIRMIQAKSSYIHFSEPDHVDRSCKELRREQLLRELNEKAIARKIIRRFMRYAATILLLIGLSVTVFMYFTHWQNPRMLVVALGENEQPKQIMLDDSSRVWLSAGSRMEYPERFGKKVRKVSVEGKIYFDVARDAERPFYVITDAYTVKVLGTSFEVNAPRYHQTSDVTLVEGKVEILNQNSVSLCTLQSGQQFEINRLNNRYALHQVDAEMYASWLGGRLEFDGLTFSELAKVIERQYGVRIILDEGIAKKLKLVGSLSLEKDIYQMMKALELVVPIKYRVQTDTVVYIQSK